MASCEPTHDAASNLGIEEQDPAARHPGAETRDRAKVVSVSGRGSASIVATLLRGAFDFGQLSQIRRLARTDEQNWIEFEYCSHTGLAGNALLIATDDRHRVVGGQLWRTPARPVSTTYEDVDGLRRNLRFVHSVETVREAIVNSDGEVLAISFEFSAGSRYLLARR